MINIRSTLFSKKYDLFMFACCVLYCFTAMQKFEISSLFKNIIIFGSIPLVYFCLKDKSYDKKIIWLFLASLLIQILSWINSTLVIPEFARNVPDIKPLSSLFLFVFIAFWVESSTKKRLFLFGTLIFSFLFSIFHHDYFNNSLHSAILGGREDFGLHNAQYTTMISAVVMMTTAYLTLVLITKKSLKIVVPISIIIFSFSSFIFIVSQSRQVWLAIIIIVLLLPVILRKKLNKSLIIYCYLVIISMLFMISTHSDMLQKRVSLENVFFEQIMNGDWHKLPMTSFGIRFNSWLEATDWIIENPVIGASNSAIKQILQTSEIFQSNPKLSGFGHLHNYYIETIVAFGLVGAMFLMNFYYTIFKNITSHRDYQTSIFFLCFLIFWIIINNFESYNSKYYGLYIQSIILGGLFYMPKPISHSLKKSSKT